MIKQVDRVRDGKRVKVWVYDLRVGGRRVRTPRGEYFYTKEECIDAASSIRTDYRRERYKFPTDRSRVTIGELREAWIAGLKEAGRSKGHIQRTDRALQRLRANMWGTDRVLDIKRAHLQKFYSSCIQAGMQPQTASAELTALMSALNNAGEVFESLADWRPPKRPSGVSGKLSGRERVISHEEEQRIITALMEIPKRERKNPYYHRARRFTARLFWVALRTGMREGELLGLRKSSVRLERAVKMPDGYIEVRRSRGSDKTKTGGIRAVPLTPQVAETLREQMAESESVYVFPSPRNLSSRWESIRIGFMQACKRAGVPYGHEEEDGLVFHDTRHTAATRMLHAGKDLKTIGSILGHSKEYMTMHYAHPTAESRLSAVSSLSDESFRVHFGSIPHSDGITEERRERDRRYRNP